MQYHFYRKTFHDEAKFDVWRVNFRLPEIIAKVNLKGCHSFQYPLDGYKKQENYEVP